MRRLSWVRNIWPAILVVAVWGQFGSTTVWAQQTVGPCSVLPANNIWNTPVDTLPVLSNSATMVTTIGATTGFHADFGSGLWDGGPIGIPFVTVAGTQTKYPVSFLYADESDPGPYAMPLNAPIEGGSGSDGDRHAIAIDTTNCILYELYRAFPGSSNWTADSGAIYHLGSNALRPSTWTSADAAGLPIMPGLVTYDEMASGQIKHAIRFTAPQSRHAFVWPARHYASSLTGTQYPRMGERFRLKAGFDISTFPADVQVILRAMKKYGIIMADNGSAWYISGKPDSRWNNDNLSTLSRLKGSSFEAVDATVLQISADSGEAKQPGVSVAVSPASATVRAGRSKDFTASVTGVAAGFTWSVNNATGGNTTVGTIDTAGHYLAPLSVPNPATVTVRAASTASPSSSGSAAVTIIPLPTIMSISPAQVQPGNFTLTINGVGFTTGSKVTFDGRATTTLSASATKVMVLASAPAVKSSVPVVLTASDGERSNTFYMNVVAAPVTIGISPASASVLINRTLQFTATVQNTSNKAVTWKVNGVVGGNGKVGTISTTGLYRAPAAVPSPAVVSVSATSVAAPTKVASAAVTIKLN
jgi:hypothetical protein